MSRAKSARLGLSMAVLSAVCFSSKAIFAKLAYRHGVDPITMLALRSALALPCFLVASFAFTGPPLTPRERVQVFLLGSAGYYTASLLDFIGLAYVSAGLERLILFLYPTIVIALNVLFHGERPSRRLLEAVLLSYGGVGLVAWNDRMIGGTDVALGASLVFLSAVAYAGYIAFSQPLILRHGSARVTSYVLSVTSACAILQFALEGDYGRLAQKEAVYALAAATALLATVLPTYLLTAGMARVGTSRAALVGTLGPVCTMVLATVVLDEPMTLLSLVGSSLVLVGIWRVGKRHEPEDKARAASSTAPAR